VEEEVSKIVKSLREEAPEVWIRHWRDNNFVIIALTLPPGEEEIVVERFKEVFG
jgi:hypothetical protein